MIERLHRIQDQQGYLTLDDLDVLGAELILPRAAVYEVATFYHGFRIREAASDPKPVLQVCTSLACHIVGAPERLEVLREAFGGQFEVEGVACLGRCEAAPCGRVRQQVLTDLEPDAVAEVLAAPPPKDRPVIDFDAYLAEGGYHRLQALVRGETDADWVLGVLHEAGLRGLGGAGFPTGRKWTAVRAETGPKLMAVNSDESEPGTFKDRVHLETDPHRVLEGMLIGAITVGAEACYFFLRDEYDHIRRILETEIPKLAALGLKLPRIELRRGAGNYICGEESAMLEALEGKRGLPRQKPPYPSQVGLFDRPTLINNVETLYWIRALLENGPDWFAGFGRNGRKGLRSFSVSGRVAEPGMKVAPAGISLRELIEEHCGGMAPGHTLKAFLPGGASGGILPAYLADQPLDFGTLEEHGGMIGSAAVIVLSDKDDLADAARNLMAFFKHESCGQCTPCRVGTGKALALMHAPSWNAPLLTELGACMTDASICGLGQAAPNVFKSLLRHFPEEVR
ncbi:NAD(P)H-dependent oxidoreductase subunit E [Indioceanicola profundi]|uniref:NAD(P)H-dependent oxidoreductase subunit E n=1 Tax=Indioceanicola profundi TaxID=2220096 RepID=UPI00384FB412